ncbi:hypothetical protein [Parvicella tangerina]|uniref:Lipoprotein n=1 Tax=Parvicella tangerina TaxID=2829795 RepID=A0A916JLH0_9FLAO|nr:hypothetical protein [Parvicella tangerina]CAG5079362.1 hypothetical protein CRYO30217_00924 [Parvicella tangerina]
MKNWTIGIVFILTVLMVACANPYEDEIEDVEGMQEVLSGVKQTYGQVDIAKVNYAMEMYLKNMKQIKTYYKPDTVDENVTKLVNFYKGIKHSAKGFEDEYYAVGMQIEFMDKQLKTLQTDMENKADFNDSLETFLKNEQNNLDELSKNVGTLLYNYDFIISVHDSVASKVQNILLENVE